MDANKKDRLEQDAREKIRLAIGEPDTCWPWPKYLKPNGYGFLRVVGKNKYVHRLSYEMFVGPIPEGMTIDHLCKMRHCINPAHMEVVTRGENSLRGESPFSQNARKTHCKHGHEFTAENTRFVKMGRECKVCGKEKSRKRSMMPDVQEKRRLYKQRPEVKARNAEYDRLRGLDPSVKAKRAASERARRKTAREARERRNAKQL